MAPSWRLGQPSKGNQCCCSDLRANSAAHRPCWPLLWDGQQQQLRSTQQTELRVTLCHCRVAKFREKQEAHQYLDKLIANQQRLHSMMAKV